MWDKVGPRNWRRPLLLQPDNFTPPERTPWGGRRIAEQLKRNAGLEVRGVVGEAWELSVEPDFPSRIIGGPTLDEALRSDPVLLGREAALGSTALLVKLVDAADDLSVQIHPADTDPLLAASESGKPEAWYILDAEPSVSALSGERTPAGLYLGFRDGVSRQDIETAIDQEGAVDALMSFVPVAPGDVFLIEPGTPHAIGKGVLLLEPQRVSPGKRGLTYRYWDWNRRYDAAGRLDPGGQPRALHRERALDVTDWEGQRGHALLDRVRHRAGPAAIDGPASLETIAGDGGPLESEVFSLQRLAGSGDLALPADDRLRSLTVLDGALALHDGETVLELGRGQTAALPACLGPLRVELDAAHAMLCTLA
ncbi:MAG: class I mannose-6-phosphate isomerase [Deltaproteobacteria bacterium]|jgi:mannose-6-phosphate isomerase class I|nr:class I mannose-6-phosphate isomerase [Deltaproteobacteria bacterium]